MPSLDLSMSDSFSFTITCKHKLWTVSILSVLLEICLSSPWVSNLIPQLSVMYINPLKQIRKYKDWKDN